MVLLLALHSMGAVGHSTGAVFMGVDFIPDRDGEEDTGENLDPGK